MAEQLWKKNLINITPYVAGEQSKNPDIIKLNANENPYPPSPMVQTILNSEQTEVLRKYPSADAYPLRCALAEMYGVGVENVFCGNGSDDVLATAFRAFFNSEKPIFYPDITYSFYPVWCELLKIPYETKKVDENFEIKAEDFYAENGGVVFPNPNAPTSIAVSTDFIEDILQHNKDCIVIIDEAYIDFAKDNRSCVKLIEKYDNLLVTQTFSKSRSMAGMRLGMAFGNAELIKYMGAVKDSYNSYPINSLSIATGVASVKDKDYFEKVTAKIKLTRDETAEEMRKLGFKVYDSETNFLFVSHNKYKAEDIFKYLKSKDIFVRFFDKPRIDNCLRITIGTDDEMQSMLTEIKNYIK